MSRPTLASIALIAAAFAGCSKPPAFDVVIRHGTVYDGSGAARRGRDVAIPATASPRSATWAARGRDEVDATGLAVAPGFINMLSHSETSLIADGRSQGAIRQGVTLEVFGEGSMGPLTER